METQRLVNTQQDEVKTEYNIYRHYDTGNVIYSSLFGFVCFFQKKYLVYCGPQPQMSLTPLYYILLKVYILNAILPNCQLCFIISQ